MKQRILIGISSCIAAYKVIDLIKLLLQKDIAVSVVLTRNASQMLDVSKLKKLVSSNIYSELFTSDFDYKTVLQERSVEHINVADNTDLMVIAPATANIIAKLAHGIADDYLTTAALAVTKPLLICPSMNVNMWNNPVVQDNIEKLRSFGHHIIEPTEGELACGYVGKGRLEDIDVIKQEILNRLNQIALLKGKRIIITAGGTTEPIDNVRFITNKSSGKMGIALAEQCFLKGASVTLLRAKSAVKPRFLMKEELFETTRDLYTLVKKHAPKADIIFHVAAVSDFTVANQLHGKISSKQTLNLTLSPTIKISNEIKKMNPNTLLVLFKAEYGLDEVELLDSAKVKLQDANADIVVANDVSKENQGFGSDFNQASLLTKTGKYKKFALQSKKTLAEEVIQFMIEEFQNVLSTPSKNFR